LERADVIADLGTETFMATDKAVIATGKDDATRMTSKWLQIYQGLSFPILNFLTEPVKAAQSAVMTGVLCTKEKYDGEVTSLCPSSYVPSKLFDRFR
jgi:hypothetical protein